MKNIREPGSRHAGKVGLWVGEGRFMQERAPQTLNIVSIILHAAKVVMRSTAHAGSTSLSNGLCQLAGFVTPTKRGKLNLLCDLPSRLLKVRLTSCWLLGS